jgi:hypothetical protein
MSIFYQTAYATPLIQLPADFTSSIGSSTSDTLSTFSSYIVLIIGILLAGVILEIIISAIRHK